MLQGQQNRFPSQHLPPLRLSLTVEEWQLADEVMSVTVVPAVLLCETVDEKNIALCDGVYQYFSQHFGTARQVQRKGPRQDKEQSSRLKKITQQKNYARKKLRDVKKYGTDETAIRVAAREFHRLLRLHSKESRLSYRSRASLEALKARRSCVKSFWRFAAQLFDEDKPNISPAFSASEAESFFSRSYSSEPREFVRPTWLPVPPLPDSTFNEDPISHDEIQQAVTNSKGTSTPSPNIKYHMPS